MDNAKAHHAPLHPDDTIEQTVGCRHTTPKNCAKNSMPDVCAFVRSDNMCQAPPRSWPRQFDKLSEAAGKTNPK